MITTRKDSSRLDADLTVKYNEKLVAYHTGFNTNEEGVYAKGCCYFCKRTGGADESSVFINGQPIDKPIVVKHYCFSVRDLIYVYPVCDECAVILNVFSDPIEAGLKVLGDEEFG